MSYFSADDMTFTTLFEQYRIPIILLMLVSPWLAWGTCCLIPGKREEPFVLSLNLALSVTGILCLIGYLAYASNTGGWQKFAQQADVFLLLSVPYHFAVSIWLSKTRLPLERIPSYRFMQGLVMMGGVYLVLSWLARRIYIVFFSYIPFQYFLVFLAALVIVAYVGYEKVFGE